MTTKTNNAAAAPAISLFTKKAEIDRACKDIHSTGYARQELMHKTACSVLAHFGKHKDVRLVYKLVQAMIDSDRVNALRDWLVAFGPFAIDKDQITVLPDGKVRLGEAMAKPFWKFKATEGKPYEPIQFDTYVEQQIKKLQKDMKETGRDHSALINAMKLYTTQPTAHNIEPVQPAL